MPSFRITLLATCLVLAGVCVQAQTAGPPQLPTVAFKLSWDKGLPWSDYSFTVNENGAAHFKATGNPMESGDNDIFEQDFTMSEANLQEVFRLAKAADYFQGQFESKVKNVAKTGTKTLEFHSPSLNTSTTYNYAPNPNIQQLTKLFQAIAVTIDYGRKLSYQYRFDKLGMDTRLKELVDLRASGMADEIQIIQPILSKIAEDGAILHVARLEAKQLLKSSGADASNSKPASQQP